MLRVLRMYRQTRNLVASTVQPQQTYVSANSWSAAPLKHTLSLQNYRWTSTKPATVGKTLQSTLAGSATVDDVLNVWEAHRGSVHTHNVVRSCLHYSLKAAKSQQLTLVELFQVPRFQLFWQHLTEEVPSMSANTAIKCLYNCAQFDLKHQPLALSLVDVCTQKSKSIPPVSIGILLWSLKRLDLIFSSSAGPLVAYVIDLFHAKLCSGERFRPPTLSNILWVLASTGNLPTHISARVTDCLPQYMQEFDFHSLSLCLWSLTTSGATLSPQLLGAAGSAATKFLKEQRNVQNIVHCSWAFGSAEFYHRQYCNTLSQVILKEPRTSPMLTPRLVSSVVWMCAKVGYYDPALLDYVASLTLHKLCHFNAQDLGNLTHAFAQLNHPHPELIKAITTQFVSDSEMLGDDHACVSVAWANIAIGEYPLPLLKHLMEPHRVRNVIEKKDQNSLNFLLRLQALQRAECTDLDLSLPHKTAVFASTLVQTRWSHTYTNLLHSVVSALLKIVGDSSYITTEALTTTLYSIDIEMILDASNNPIPIPEHWQSWTSLHSLMTSPLLKKNHSELYFLLKDLCKEHLNGHECTLNSTESSGQVLNLASDWRELVGGPVSHTVASKVAIEVDGPWHYAANCSHILGKTLLKQRVLRCLGWRIVSIPYLEWKQLKMDSARVEFLRTKIFKAD